jgi:hypothetical protein
MWVLVPVEEEHKGIQRGAQSSPTPPHPEHPARSPVVILIFFFGSAVSSGKSLSSVSMASSEVFNPNPTIIATAGPTTRKRAAHASRSLWLSDDDEDSTFYDSSDGGEPEPIDADEVFGAGSFFFFFSCYTLD